MKSNQMSLSASFKKTMGDIVDSDINNLYELQCKIMVDNTTDNTTNIINVTSYDINTLTIEEDFYNNYRDVILMNVDLTENNYLLVTKHSQNIRASIVITKRHDDGTSSLVGNKTYMLMLRDQAATTFSEDNSVSETIEGDGESQYQISFELIERIAYSINKKRINFGLSNTNIEAAIMFSAKLFGFEKVFIVTPDNDKEYDVIIVPPLMGLEELLDYLQGYPAYGIYSTGINHYIKDDTLYVLPLCKTNTSEFQFNIFNGGADAFAGSDNYHSISDNGINIVVPDGARVISMSQAMVENIGNSYIVNTPLKHIDKSGELISDGVFNVDKEFITNITASSTKSGMNKNAYTQSYVMTDNVFNIHSDIVAMDVIKINGIWPHAYPFLTNPAVCVGYHYDSGNRINTMKGWCDYIKYEFDRCNSMTGNLMTCVASFCISVIK